MNDKHKCALEIIKCPMKSDIICSENSETNVLSLIPPSLPLILPSCHPTVQLFLHLFYQYPPDFFPLKILCKVTGQDWREESRAQIKKGWTTF